MANERNGFSDPFFKGCTRPAMFMGVPMIPFLLVTGTTMVAGVWLVFLFSAYFALALSFVYAPVLLWMRDISKKDDQRLRQMMLRARLRMRLRAIRSAWGAVSYSPTRYKKR